MRKLTFETLPSAIAEILERLDRVEQLLNGETPSKPKAKKTETKIAEGSMDIKDAAKFLNVTVASMYSYVKNKKVPFEKQGGKLVFSGTALETWKQAKDKNKKSAGKKSAAKKTAVKKSTGKKAGSKKVNNQIDAGQKDMNIAPGELITAQEAQKLFNMPLPSIYYIIKTRKLPVVEKKGRALFYSKDELSKALNGKQKKSEKKS
jgi:hypothetical protein